MKLWAKWSLRWLDADRKAVLADAADRSCCFRCSSDALQQPITRLLSGVSVSRWNEKSVSDWLDWMRNNYRWDVLLSLLSWNAYPHIVTHIDLWPLLYYWRKAIILSWTEEQETRRAAQIHLSLTLKEASSLLNSWLGSFLCPCTLTRIEETPRELPLSSLPM